MRGGAVLLSVVVVAACGRYDFADLPPAPDAPPAPARLTSTYYEVGGMPVENGVYDATLDTKCHFGMINGSIRCVPDGMTVVYADATCTQEVAAKQSCTTDTRYVLRGDIASSGDPTQRLFHAGASRGVTPTYIHNGPNGCGPWATIDTFDIADEIAVDTLVEATTETVPGTRIDTINYVSPEGVRQTAYFHDHDLGFDCDIGASHDGYQCGPSDIASATSYSTSAACSDHVGQSQTPPDAVRWSDFGGCSLTDVYFYAVAGTVSSTSLYTNASGTCTTLASAPAGTYYVSGAPIATQPITIVPDSVGGQRVVRTRFTGGGVALPVGLYDTQLGVACNAATMSDGSVRCVPEGAYATSVYTDSSCTTLTTFGEWQDFPGCAQDQFKYVVGGTRTSCSSSLDVYEIGAVFTGLFWVKDQQSNCSGPYSAGTGNPRYWNLGRKLDPSELVEATLP